MNLDSSTFGREGMWDVPRGLKKSRIRMQGSGKESVQSLGAKSPVAINLHEAKHNTC